MGSSRFPLAPLSQLVYIPHQPGNKCEGHMDEGRKVISDDFARQLSPETALPVAAIKTLIGVIRRSTNTTIRGMEAELKDAIQLMEDKMETDSPDNSRSEREGEREIHTGTGRERVQ